MHYVHRYLPVVASRASSGRLRFAIGAASAAHVVFSAVAAAHSAAAIAATLAARASIRAALVASGLMLTPVVPLYAAAEKDSDPASGDLDRMEPNR